LFGFFFLFNFIYLLASKNSFGRFSFREGRRIVATRREAKAKESNASQQLHHFPRHFRGLPKRREKCQRINSGTQQQSRNAEF
jgi:hypothetical protein